MPLLRRIDGTGWAALDGQVLNTTNSGASAATRLSAVTTSAWTVRALGPVKTPPGSSATGYLESAVNSAAMIQIDPTGTALPGSPPTGDAADYWLDFWLMGVWDGTTTLPAATAASLVIASTGTFARARLWCNGASGYNPPGFALDSQNSVGGNSTRQIIQAAGSSGVAYWMWGEWQRICVHYKYGAGSAGLTEVYVNGVLVSSTAGDTTTSNITWSAQPLQISVPAWTGVRWRIAGPIQSYSGVDLPCSPAWALDDQPSSLTTRVYLPWNVQSSASQGSFFTSSGTGAVATDAEYAAAASSPSRHRLIFSGNGSAPAVTTIDEIGALPFNEQGWASVVLSDAYVPTGTTLQLLLYQAGGSTELIRLFITSGTVNAFYSGGPAIQATVWQAANRHCLALHLNRDGRVRLTVADLSATFDGSGKTVWSAPLVDWSPQPIGKVALLATTTTSNVETGLLAICKRPSFTTIDSLTSASYAAVSPNIHSATCVQRAFPYGEEGACLPGAWYPQKEYGLERRLLIAPLGRPGKTRRDWMQSVGSGLTHTCGCEIIAIDGGGINDISVIATNDAKNVGQELKYNLEAFIRWAVGNDNAAWFATMLPRGRSAAITAATNASPIVLTVPAHGISGTVTRAYVSGVGGNSAANGFYASVALTDANTMTLTGSVGNGAYTSGGAIQGYTPQEWDAITQFNADLRALLAKYQVNALLSVSDLETDVVVNPATYPNTGGAAGFWQDFTHPNSITATNPNLGAGIIARRMVQLKTVPPSARTFRRPARALVARS